MIIWRLINTHNSYKLTVYESFKDQKAQISSIFFSYDLKCFAVSSLDGSVFLYNIITGKKIRAYYHPNSLPVNEVKFILIKDHNQYESFGIDSIVLESRRIDLLLQYQWTTNSKSA